MKIESIIRQSNFELLRILAMAFILALHVNYFSIGAPDAKSFLANPLNSLARVLFENLAIVAVNVFVLISGWFGIKATRMKFCSLLFQCFFFSIGLYVVKLIFGHAHQSCDALISFAIIGGGLTTYWFVISYIAVFLLSPFLNTCLMNMDLRRFRTLIIGLFAFEFVYGWLVPCDFRCGYSCLHLIWIYILGGYLRRRSNTIKNTSGWFYAVLFLSCILINTIVHIFQIKYPSTGIAAAYFECDMLAYTCPTVILGAVFLLLTFSNLKFSSPFVNSIASSVLAVYLFHLHPAIVATFKNIALKIYTGNSGIMYLSKILMYIIIVFAIAVLIDRIRIWCWKLVSKCRVKNV